MTLGTEVKIDLVLLAQKYKEGLAQVDGSTTASGKVAERVFMRMEKDAQQAAAMYGVLGDDSKKLSSDQSNLEAAIKRLTKAGFSAQSPEVTALVNDYKRLKDESSHVEAKQKTLAQSFASLRDIMQGPIAAARMAVDAFKEVVKVGSELYMEYADAEKGQIVFAQAMKESEQMSSSAATNLKTYAEELQQLTGLDAENTQAIMANLAVQGKSEKQILDLTEAAANYAAATGIDIDTAVKQLNSTLSGNVGLMGRQNVAIKNLTEEQLKSGKAIEIINQQYAGMAEVVGKSALGASQRLNANVGDLKEALGEVVAYKFGPLIENLVNAAKDAADKISSNTNIGKVISGDTADLESVNKAFIDIQNAMSKINDTGWEYDEWNGKVRSSLGMQYDAIKKIQTEASKNATVQEKAKIEANKNAEAALASAKALSIQAEANKWIFQDSFDFYERLNKGIGVVKKSLYDWSNIQTSVVAANTEAFEDMVETTGTLADSNAELAANAFDFYNNLGYGIDYGIEKTKELTEAQKALGGAMLSGATSVVESLGAALVTGEEGWRGFAKSGLNAIAAIVEAMAVESDILIAKATAQALLGDFTKIPGLGAAIAASALAHGAAGAIRAIPMKEGGAGVTTGPTLFHVEKAGEPFAFGGENNKLGMGMGGGVTQNFYIGGSVIAERQVMQLGAAGVALAGRGY